VPAAHTERGGEPGDQNRIFVLDWSGTAARNGSRGLIDTMILMVRLVLENLFVILLASYASG
jgi:hypothetical protein